MNITRDPAEQVAWGIALVVVVDLVTKLGAFAVASGNTSGVVVPVRNHEFSLGIAGAPLITTIVIAAIGIAIAAAFIVPRVRRGTLAPWIPMCLIGGGLGNLVDRIAFGSVHDFIATPWVVFNVADAAVVAAFVGLLATRLRHQKAMTNRTQTTA